jgi:phosphoglycolate phosphatase-like HAD superfamily hydrolase
VQIRNVILDWSGTLVNDLPPVFDTTNHVFATFGLPALTLDEFRREFCLPIRKFYEQRIPNVPQTKLEGVFLTRYHKVQNEITLLPDTLSFLKFCQGEGLGVFIASTVDAHTYETQAARFGLTGYITKPYIGIEDKTQKIHHIIEENRLAPEATLFVGDMEHDIDAGKHGGVHTCAVLTGYNHVEKLRATEPDVVCENLSELQQWIKSQSKTSK